ncbi:MAG: DUF1211 domain-containing protein [Chloroflexi bacterium]|nr:DUF1211 domain-containing protein [Chloroflexota bacterium]
MTRIETFTDAAFAFALTLLIISFEPPTSLAELTDAFSGIPAFVLSAAMLMLFWWGHHQWSRRYGQDDGVAFLLSCALVLTMLVYVYPLRFMFGVMMAWIGGMTGIPLGAGVSISGPEDVNRLFAIYGIGFSTMAACIVLLNAHAWRCREALELTALERFETRSVIGSWGILAVVGVISTLVALTVPSHHAGLPGWVYFPLWFVMPMYGTWMNRRRPVEVAPAPSAQVPLRGVAG